VAAVTVCSLSATVNDVTSHSGDSVTLSANVTGNRPGGAMYYLWYRGNAGDTSNLVTGGPSSQNIMVSPATTTKYWVRVNDSTCTVDSNVATVSTCLPKITAQPQSIMISSGASTTLSVTATGDNLSYQWYQGSFTGTPVGTNSPTFTTPPLTTATSYWVRVSGCYPADSVMASITICQPPAATTPYTLFQIQSGQQATLGVTVTGTSPTLQWYQGVSGNIATPLAGKTTTPITVSPTATTQYWARASNQCANGDGPTITVDVCDVPSITTQPANVAVALNGTATLSVAASTSPGTVTYQWYRGASGDMSVPVGTNATTFATPAITADTQYWVRVTRGACSANSNAATVYACTLLASVNNVQTKSGQAATLTASTANERGTLSYTWYRGNAGDTSNPTGFIGSQMTQTVATSTNYWVRVSDGICTANSNTATISTCIPNVTSNPASVTINNGTSTTLTVVATGDALSYQWYQGAAGVTTTPVGSNSASLSVNPTSTTSYWVRVTGCQTANSTAATVTVCVPATATTGNTFFQIQSGQQQVIGVTVTGTSPTLQWYQGVSGSTTTPLSGKTTTPITVAPTATTQYWARASNQCANGDSPTITVDVCNIPTITTNPADVSVPVNGTTTLSVAASTSPGTVIYQWYRGASGDMSVPVGTNATTYTTPAITADTQYWVRVTRGACSANSNAATVYACTLSASANSVQTKSNQAATVTSSVSNARAAVTYTWYRGNSGDTSNPLGISASQITYTVATTTNYWVRVSDGTCTVNSSTGSILTCIPNITSNPASVTIASGTQTTLTVTATGDGLSYQWYQGAAGVTTTPVGTNSNTLVVSPSSTTSYWVRVTGCQVANSTAATVTICQVPGITSISGGGAAQPGTTTGVAVTATGTGLTYQWYMGQAGDTTHPVFTNIRNPTFTASQTAYYWVKVSNTCGSINSSVVVNSVYPQIYSFTPGSTPVPYNSHVTLSCAASGTYLSYQWYVGDVGHPVGSPSPTYTTPNLTANASYICGVSSGIAISYTAWADLTICTPPLLDSAYTQTAGTGCWYVVAAVNGQDSWNVNYTWYKGATGDTSQPIGQTGNYATVCPTVTTSYWCRIWFNDSSCYKDTPTLTVH
jgi:hypothetical protein